jgi:uncharacterized protein
MPGDALLVFVKRPRPGEVKTRLAPHLGDEAAAALYRLIAEEILRRTRPARGRYQRLCLFTPSEGRFEFEAAWPEETWLDQATGDLGDRMTAAFAEVFARGTTRAVLIGSDIPRLSSFHVRQALAALESHDLVLGPAHDGGYYLVGLARLLPELFTAIPWSTSGVLATTLERARALGLRVSQLEELTDLDTLEDLRREWPHLQSLLTGAPALRATIERALSAPPVAGTR